VHLALLDGLPSSGWRQRAPEAGDGGKLAAGSTSWTMQTSCLVAVHCSWVLRALLILSA
jgi:hypothetical protein